MCEKLFCLDCFDEHECRFDKGRVKDTAPHKNEPICVCPQSGAQIRRTETGGMTQAQLDARCTGLISDEPCFDGCARGGVDRWLYAGKELEDL